MNLGWWIAGFLSGLGLGYVIATAIAVREFTQKMNLVGLMPCRNESGGCWLCPRACGADVVRLAHHLEPRLDRPIAGKSSRT